MKAPGFRQLFFAIELNLLLWIVALFSTHGSVVSVLGFLLAAVVQHWAYYHLRKKSVTSANAPENQRGARNARSP